MGRQKLFIYVNITVDNSGKLERIVTATLRVSLGVDGSAKEGGGDGEGKSFPFLPPPLPCSNFSTPLKFNMAVIYASRHSRTRRKRLQYRLII